MSARWISALAKLGTGAWVLCVLLVAAALAVEGWLLVLRQPLAEYRSLRALNESLRDIERLAGAQEDALRISSARAEQLAARLKAALQDPGSEEQMTVSLMRRLDEAAAAAGIVLTGLKPAGRRAVLSFDELSFQVGAQGRYLSLCQWLLDFEHALGASATVSEFDMRATDPERRVALTLRLALYRPLQDGDGPK